ncbi:metallophosphoesterase domain-containing protein 1 [Capsaspora owczarzaki ATCC 30864]|uniref:metallophosphoesterase domain-containing protein 1 n=1 Tax=Capsaspora owczarzaki (strain ATCC 30864) TaxID=595528 RepID=UPI0003526442|nr:metallophosphoesterase domain-containing protein 1 [Capsaspora owczarzaki ATCC 30864]|eukprot:XP_004345783.2 metallophosphoesterase domain-containing protein 1 [Capsaspora owczarzaki ATCC 30864]
MAVQTGSADAYWESVKHTHTVETVEPVDAAAVAKPEGFFRVVCISDTHSLTDKLVVPDGDLLVHAGDFSNKGSKADIVKFNEFLGRQPHKHKVVIAGNHDLTLDESNIEELREQFRCKDTETPAQLKALLTNCIYLEDALVEVEGFRIYGSPWTPYFFGWGFNLERGAPIRAKWDLIPNNVDILITHGPPVGYGDRTTGGNYAGCADLLEAIQSRIKPKLHVSGHIHEGAGLTRDEFGILYANASTCTHRYQPVLPAIVVDLPKKN